MAWRIKPKRRAAVLPGRGVGRCGSTAPVGPDLPATTVPHISPQPWMPHLPHRCLNASAATTTRFAPLLLMQVFQYRELCARCWRIPVARRTMLHVWRAGEAGIHCSVLCRRTDLTLSELRSLLTSMYHGLRRFQRERGCRTSRCRAISSIPTLPRWRRLICSSSGCLAGCNGLKRPCVEPQQAYLHEGRRRF